MKLKSILTILVLLLLSITFLSAQTSTKTVTTTVAKTTVPVKAKTTVVTTAKTTVTTPAKTGTKKKSTKSTTKTSTVKKATTTVVKTQTTTTKTTPAPVTPAVPKPSLTNTTKTNPTPVSPIAPAPTFDKTIQLTPVPATVTPGNTPTTNTHTRGGGTNTDNTNTNTTPTNPTTPHTRGGNNDANNTNTNGGNIITDITQGDAASAIKEALMKGVATGVAKVAITDGYFGNSFIKIPFPQDVQVVESTLRSFGMGSMIDNLVMSLNRSAENAAGQAAPIFLNGIKQMTLNDAISIVSNKQPDAATQFLQRTTTESLVSAFKPAIQTALDKSLATKYWTDITGYYNKIPFVSPVNTDLPDYVTRKAITGLFYMVAQEEAKIRKDPINQGSEIINKVFGAFKK
ncbi:MAG: DUF4197 domain-containing protein [Bacteroidetes bacterium]|nr:DUF4197 domain-containing protein [Bacteroidota bacterium]